MDSTLTICATGHRYDGMRSTFEAVVKHDSNLEGLGDLVASLVAFLGNDDDDSVSEQEP